MTTQTAEQWAGNQFQNVAMSSFPPEVHMLHTEYARKFGSSGEIVFTALAHYAIFELGLKADNWLYEPTAEHKHIWDDLPR